MGAWWLLSPEQLALDENARLDKQQAYFTTFYGGSDNMQVLNDIREICYASGKIELIELYDLIRNNAGRTRYTEQAMIEAEARAIEEAGPQE
jgi:hypothetical protein